MKNLKVITFLCSASLLAACAQQEEPAPLVMSAEPVYNKMGDVVGCTDGRTYVPGTAPAMNPCAPPSEECDPTLSSSDPNCLPSNRTDGGDSTGREPSQSTAGRP